MTCRKKRGQENHIKIEIAAGRSFVYLVMFIKLNNVFRQSNIVSIGILSLLIVKTNSNAFF